MEQIQKNFLKTKINISSSNKQKLDILRKKYINNIRNVNKKLALLIAHLYSLKFNFDNIYTTDNINYINEHSNNNSINEHNILINNKWNKFKNNLNEIKLYQNEFIKSNYSVLYKSETRNSVTSNLINVISDCPLKCKIFIHNCKDIFLYNGKKIYSKLVNNKYILMIDNSTIIEIPCELIQLKGDTIEIEYTDIFTSRYNNTYYYKGWNKSTINQITNIFNNTISKSNIQQAIDLIKTML